MGLGKEERRHKPSSGKENNPHTSFSELCQKPGSHQGIPADIDPLKRRNRHRSNTLIFFIKSQSFPVESNFDASPIHKETRHRQITMKGLMD